MALLVGVALDPFEEAATLDQRLASTLSKALFRTQNLGDETSVKRVGVREHRLDFS